MKQITIMAALLLMFTSTLQAAPGQEFVRDYFNSTTSFQADFDQLVVDGEFNVQQSSQGRMWIARPGRFRWDYETPYHQQIVADGERLWSYDQDLEQVTVQQVSSVLTSTPAMLLSGTQPLQEVFNIAGQEQIGETRQVLLVPRSADSNVTNITLYFESSLLVRIQALDTFGNTTTFSFYNMKRNQPLDSQLFQFVPPDNTDVIGDAG